MIETIQLNGHQISFGRIWSVISANDSWLSGAQSK
jgi:hypothetical protein